MPALMLFAIILIAGVLLRAGLRRRRRGTTPHCRRCGYNLTGLVSPYCPECGLVLDETEIVYGEPYRRPVFAVVGGVLLVLAVAGVVSGVRRGGVNWYRYYPTTLVLRDAQSANAATAVKAWGELRGRLTAGSLSAGQRADLIDVALKMQAPSFPFAATVPSYLSAVADVLAQLYLNRQLTKPQEDQFFKQIVTFQLRVRPQVAVGDEVPYVVEYREYGPLSVPGLGQFWVSFSYGGVCVDQVSTGFAEGRNCGALTGSGNSVSHGSSVPCQVPGRHMLSLVATGKVYVGTVLSEAESELCGRVDTPLQASFDVLAAEPNGFVRLMDDPSLAPALHACIIPDVFEGRDAETRFLSVTLKIDAPPVPICFDVFVRVGDRECWLSYIAVRQGAPNVNYDLPGCGQATPVEKCDIILRSSPESARKTVDLTEIWSGELVYKDVLVKVARGLATQPTTTGSPTPEPD
jgi:predicted RNA-binding Zn-ribbon protein involved in translation (DUF1610 family)